MKKVFVVKGMHCKSCEMLIKDAVESTPGVTVLSASHSSGKVEVAAADESGLEAAKRAIESEGYAVVG